MESGDDESSGAAAGSDAPATSSSGETPLSRGEAVLIGSIVVVLLGAVVLGMGGAGGPAGSVGTGTGSTSTPVETGTPAERAPAVTMQVRSIETCGTRCRSVTVALTNEGEAPARDVRVETRITADGSLVWDGRSDVGRLDAGETVTRTRTVEVGYVDAARIEANDGVVRTETTVRTANGTRVFTERRDVS